MEGLERYLRALLLLYLEEKRGDAGSTTPAAVLLQRAGFTVNEIAEILGGKPEGVKSTLKRAKLKPKRGKRIER